MIEGFDLQAAGVAAPMLVPAMKLSPAQAGLFFAAATFGLIVGALAGGRISDRFGRRAGLIVALLTFGLFSVATGFARNFEGLFAARLMTGIGLGAALPNLVAIAAEASRPGRTASAVAAMYAGMPLGGAIAAALSVLGLHGGWQTIFIVGGVAPVLVVPLLARWLPALKPEATDAEPGSGAGPGRASTALFGSGRRGTTLALWTGFFCALLVLYLLLNWLPSLLVARGLDRTQAGVVQILFNLAGATASIVVGRAMDRPHRARAAMLTFGCLIGALILLAAAPSSFAYALIAGTAVGAAVMPVQAILYGLAPTYYAAGIRGTGVGAAVAAGRLGSVAGPLLAGTLVAAGRESGEVLAGIVPIAAIAALATIWLVTRPTLPLVPAGD